MMNMIKITDEWFFYSAGYAKLFIEQSVVDPDCVDQYDRVKKLLDIKPHFINYVNFDLLKEHPIINFKLYAYLLHKKKEFNDSEYIIC